MATSIGRETTATNIGASVPMGLELRVDVHLIPPMCHSLGSVAVLSHRASGKGIGVLIRQEYLAIHCLVILVEQLLLIRGLC